MIIGLATPGSWNLVMDVCQEDEGNRDVVDDQLIPLKVAWTLSLEMV